ncbi:hypothetical protein [Candidatus Pelagibacter bacterium nBUS_28]|jgi:hypothetical protein|uniref:hypothetical protein n=1 Tax=Candidatus Pelagibacter bacterium nBUS_28 TaxID=3374189 RepID=UPI003EBA1ED0
MKIKTSEITLFIFSFLVLFFIIWKTNSYLINGAEEIYVKNLYNTYILSPNYEFIFVGNDEDRKFFRKFNLYFLSYLYLEVSHFLHFFKLDNNLILYFHYSLISFTLSGGIFFTLKCVEKISNENLHVIWIYILSTTTYILVVGGIYDEFSHFEFFFISGCLYFSIKKKLTLFILFSFFAVANRETGILTFFIYFLLNKKDLRNFIVSISPIIFFIVSNISFFFEYPFDLSKIIFVSSKPNLTLLDIFSMEKKKFLGSLLYTLIIYCPLIYCSKNYKIFTNMNYSFLFFLYLIILNFGTFVGNIYPQLVIIPFISLIFFGKKIKNSTQVN